MIANWARMLFLGDSLTFGSRDPFGLSWPYYLCHLADREEYTIIPEIDAVPGRTSPQLLGPAIQKIITTQALEVFILIGTNDAKDEINLPASLYISNIKYLIGLCKAFGRREYILTIPVPNGFGSPSYSTEVIARVKSYNSLLRVLEHKRLIECSYITSTTEGIHLAVESSMKIAERVWKAIKKERNFI